MLPNARPSRSFLTFTLILSIASSYPHTLANSLIVDDWDRTSVQWDGAWMGFLDQPAPTWDGTLTWGNLSGSTVTFTFTGTSVQVFGAFKPVGTWSMQSQYAIDGGEPTTFLPPQAVQVEAYNQAFYDSGTLPAGEHTLKITNLGVELWLDYFLVDDDGGDSGGASSGIARDRASTTTTTTTTSSPAKTTTPSSSTRTTHKGTSSSTINDAAIATASTSSTSKLSTPSPLNASVSNINASLMSTAPPSATITPPLSSGPLPPSSSSTSSSNVAATTPPPGPVASQAHATGMSREALIGLIAGIAAFAVLTILLVFWYWCRRRQSRLGRGGVPYPFSSSTPSGQDMLLHPDASTYGASFRDSQYSATLGTGPRISRPASALTDLVESYADRESQMTHRRSMDGGVTLAGGPGLSGGDAPSISEAQSIKSRLPPVYQAYGAA